MEIKIVKVVRSGGFDSFRVRRKAPVTFWLVIDVSTGRVLKECLTRRMAKHFVTALEGEREA